MSHWCDIIPYLLPLVVSKVIAIVDPSRVGARKVNFIVSIHELCAWNMVFLTLTNLALYLNTYGWLFWEQNHQSMVFWLFLLPSTLRNVPAWIGTGPLSTLAEASRGSSSERARKSLIFDENLCCQPELISGQKHSTHFKANQIWDKQASKGSIDRPWHAKIICACRCYLKSTFFY